MGKSTEPLKTLQYVTAETLTAPHRNLGDAYKSSPPKKVNFYGS